VCVVSEALCSVSDGHYTESGNCLISDEEKERRALTARISHLRQRETHIMGARLISHKNGDACYGGMSPFYSTAQKRLST
jgi:hypothetical protein